MPPHLLRRPPAQPLRPQAERERAERAADELSAATFQPEISRLAQQLWSRQDGAVPAWQRLSKGGRRGAS
jgi:hypothetical protein